MLLAPKQVNFFLMTTFQAVIYSIVSGFAEFLPISPDAHYALVKYLVGWEVPGGAILGAIYLGAFLSVLVYFRHDWASIISSFLQALLLRRRFSTMDERMPILLFLSSLPVALAWLYFRAEIAVFFEQPYWTATVWIVAGILLSLSLSFSRRSKSMMDWSFFDALLIGFGQLLMLVPGGGRTTGALLIAFSRNYHKDASAKYAFLASGPLLLAGAIAYLDGVSFSKSSPMEGASWLTFGVALVVTFLAGLLGIDSFRKYLLQKGIGGYVGYRSVVGFGFLIVLALRQYGIIS